jgi:phage tail P2-like protein
MTMSKDIITLLPHNATELEFAIEQAFSKRLENVDVSVKDLWNPDTCPERLLTWLAWAMSVDNWIEAPASLVFGKPTEAEQALYDAREAERKAVFKKQREIVKHAFYVHKHKGTIGAIRKALESLNAGDIKVLEWFEYQDYLEDSSTKKPYTFRVKLPDGHNLTTEQVRELYKIVERTKNLRSHFDSLDLTLDKDPVYVLGGIYVSKSITINYED